MTKDEIFEYFYTNSVNLSGRRIIIIMIAGFLIGLLICLTYFATYKGVAYNAKFNVSLCATLLISVVIMLMISSNIVISLGMVGALSIVRFRTAIKDSRDTIFLFWAIAEGLCVGSQNFKLSLLTTLFIALIFFAASFVPLEKSKYLVIIRGSEQRIDTESVCKILELFSSGLKLRSLNQESMHSELIYELKAKGKELSPECVDQLMKIDGVQSVNLVVESGESIG